MTRYNWPLALPAACGMAAMLLAAGDVASRAAAAGEPVPSRITLEVDRDMVPLAMDFSPDGQSLAVVGARASAPTAGVLGAWDAATGRRQWRQPSGHVPEPMSAAVAFSPDGHLLAVPAGSPVNAIGLFDAGSGRARTALKVMQPAGAQGFKMAFSPDGKRLAGCMKGAPPTPYVIQLWQCPGGRLVSAMKLPPPTTESVLASPEAVLTRMLSLCRYLAFSSDAKRIAVTTGLRAELWDVRTGKQVGAAPLVVWNRQGGPANAGVVVGKSRPSLPWPGPLFSPDGKTLVAATAAVSGVRGGAGRAAESATGDEEAIVVIDAETGNVCRTIEGMPNETLAFRPNGKSVAGAAGRGERLRLTLCDLETGRLKPLLNKQLSSGRTIEHLAFSPDGSRLATLERDAASGLQPDAYWLRLWDTRTGELQVEVERPGSAASRLKLPRPGKTPAASQPGNLPAGAGGMSWPGAPFRPIPRGPYELPAAFVPARLVFSRDGSRLAVMNGPRDTEAAIDVWNLARTVSPGDVQPQETGPAR